MKKIKNKEELKKGSEFHRHSKTRITNKTVMDEFVP